MLGSVGGAKYHSKDNNQDDDFLRCDPVDDWAVRGDGSDDGIEEENDVEESSNNQ